MDASRRLDLDLAFALFLEARCRMIEAEGIDCCDPRSYRRSEQASAAYSEHIARIGIRYTHLLPSAQRGEHYFNGLMLEYRFRKEIGLSASPPATLGAIGEDAGNTTE